MKKNMFLRTQVLGAKLTIFSISGKTDLKDLDGRKVISGTRGLIHDDLASGWWEKWVDGLVVHSLGSDLWMISREKAD